MSMYKSHQVTFKFVFAMMQVGKSHYVTYIYMYIPRIQMTHISEDLTHKMVPVNPTKKRSVRVLGPWVMIQFD